MTNWTFHLNFRGWVMPLSVLAVIACGGKTADLGGDRVEPLYASGSPQPNAGAATSPIRIPWKAVDRLAYVSAIGVEQGQLFWMGSSAHANGQCLMPGDYASCQVDTCAGTVRSWPRKSEYSGDGTSVRVEVAQGVAYFGDLSSGLWSCPIDNCSEPRQSLVGTAVLDLTIRGSTLFLLGRAVILRCTASDCDNTVTRIPMRAPNGVASFTYGRRIVADDEYLYVFTDDRFLRVRQDGSNPFEVVVQRDGSIGSNSIVETGDVAADGDHVYWSEPQSGTIHRCPKMGCVNGPELLVENLIGPSDLLVDSEYVYFVEPRCRNPQPGLGTVDGVDRLSRCSIAGCTQPTVLAENAGVGFELNQFFCGVSRPHLVMDERFLYFAACDPALARPTASIGGPTPNAVSGCGIAVIPK